MKRIFTLFILLFVFLFSLNLKAQIEDIQVGNTTRKMLAYAPSTITKNQPLLISMHGMNQDIAYQKNQTQWETVANANNFVVVYPQGINNAWNLSGTTDTDFILAIIEEMYKRYGIDKNRVYLSGFSMGGMMTYYAANVIADKIAAFAPVSGYLMGGPNTNSKRPIPIIHTHGTADDVVTFSNVQTCLNAWITRNGCPTTAVVTNPYPSNKPSSNASKYYWGKGTDDVSVVLLRLEGVGHWHSNNTNGVMTSEEIWNFCKDYSLDYGIPKFLSAVVNDENPSQIRINLNKGIADSVSFRGFSVNVDNQAASIESVSLADTASLVITLNNSLTKDNEITFSYSGGNVYSKLVWPLAELKNVFVDNMLLGASPRFISTYTNENGDVLYAKFNKKMVIPKDLSLFKLKAVFSDTTLIQFNQSGHYKNDSTCLWFSLKQRVYADYKLILSNSGEFIKAADSSILKKNSDFEVLNKSTGLPVQIQSAKVEPDGINITLTFSKPITIAATQLSSFSVGANNSTISIKSGEATENTIKLTLYTTIHKGDVVSVKYLPGDVKAVDKGALTAFNNISVENNMSEPVWIEIPSKVEAENYFLQYGVQTENTEDTGGGLNVGWIENSDWMEYAINNISTSANYTVTFRVASVNANARIDFYLDNIKVNSTVSVPNTGNWQVYQSRSALVTIPTGKHYFKIVAITNGFNINFIDFRAKITEMTKINEVSTDEVNIYPNPAKSILYLESGNFNFKNIEIIDLSGQSISKKSYNGGEILLPTELKNGMYFIKFSNETKSLMKRFVIQK